MVKQKSGRAKLRQKVAAEGPDNYGSQQKALEHKAKKAKDAKLNVSRSKLGKKDPHRQRIFLQRIQESSLAGAKDKGKSKSGPKKGAFVSLAGLEEALRDTVNLRDRKRSSRAEAPSAKQRQKLVNNESVRMQQVLDHPRYKAAPLSAVAAHLEASLPQPASSKPSLRSNNGKRSKR